MLFGAGIAFYISLNIEILMLVLLLRESLFKLILFFTLSFFDSFICAKLPTRVIKAQGNTIIKAKAIQTIASPNLTIHKDIFSIAVIIKYLGVKFVLVVMAVI